MRFQKYPDTCELVLRNIFPNNIGVSQSHGNKYANNISLPKTVLYYSMLGFP